MVHLARHHQQRHDVRLAVTDAHMARAGQLAGLLGDALVTFHSAHTFKHAA